MSVSNDVQMLLSALRKHGSMTLLYELPETYFNEDERQVLRSFREHVSEYRSFPSPRTFTRETGLKVVKTHEPITYYIDRARKRALYNALGEHVSTIGDGMQDRDPDNVVEAANAIVALAASLSRSTGRSYTSLDQALDEVLADEELAYNTIGIRGITTGWPEIDEVTGGHQNTDLNTLVGRPGTGKSYLLLRQAFGAHQDGHSVLFVSMEMNAMPMARRFAALGTGVNPDYLRKGTLDTLLRGQVREQISALKGGVPFHFIAGDFGKSVPIIRGLAEELLPDIIFVDASYLLKPENKRSGSSGRREVVSDTVEELKDVNLQLDRPIVQTVQFNRTAVRSQNSPQASEGIQNPIAHLGLHKIGETDVISQISSVVQGIERGPPPFEETRRYLGFLKGREGEQGVWQVNYQFNPVNMDIISPEEQERTEPLPDQNLNYME